jgi:putative ABC transport system substrate-binding protein
MQRRSFIGLLAGAMSWPLAPHAQQSARLPIIGFLGSGTPATYSQWVVAFVQRLRELDRVEGRNIAMEYRWAEGRSERYPEIAAEFVRIKVDVIVTVATLATLAVKQATSVVPIVFVAVSDPVGTGLVASLARPGGNVTGLANQQADLAGKRLQLLHEVVPGLRRLAILGNIGNPAAAFEMGDVQAVARTLGIEVTTVEIRQAEDIAQGLEWLRGRADALYVASDPLLNSNRVRINSLALDLRLPTCTAFASMSKREA